MELCAIFDVDGTLFDTGKGIKDCVSYALSCVNAPPLSEAQLSTFIGPSLYQSFSTTAHLDDETTHAAVAHYREKYAAVGIDTAMPYPGVADMLKLLRRKGILLSIASSKPQVFVDKLLASYELTDYFCRVCAPDYAKTTSDKAALIAAAAAAPRSVMVGDTRYDVEGAHNAGIQAIAVTYGYGKREDLASADFFADSPRRVADILLAFPQGR